MINYYDRVCHIEHMSICWWINNIFTYIYTCLDAMSELFHVIPPLGLGDASHPGHFFMGYFCSALMIILLPLGES